METRRLTGIVLLTASAFTGTLAFRLATPAIAFYTKDVLRASMLYISIVSMSFVLSRALFSIIGTLSLERRKGLIYLGVATMMGNALAVHFYPFTTSWVQVAGIKAINGALNGISWPIAQFVIAAATPKRIRARVTSLYFLAGSVAALLGNYVYAYTIKLGMSFQMNVSSAFFIATGLLMLLAYRALYGVIEPKKSERKVQTPAVSARRILTMASLMAVIAAFTAGEITYVYVSEALGISRAETAVILGWTGFTAALLSYAMSWAADVWSDVRVIRITATLMALAPALAAIKMGPTVIVGIFLARFASQSFRPISRKLLVGYRRSSLAVGGINSIQNVSTFVGGITFGLAYSLGEVNVWDGVTLSLALLVFLPLSGALLWLVRGRVRG
ncbi:MAG: MFS transporter [Thermococci archaeon]|nr:MFS transporter [Thermococci archaeon]